MITIRSIRKNDFLVPWSADQLLHEEVCWFAADGDRVLGCVVRDRVDDDYGFVVLSNADGGPFCAVEVETSLTRRAATARLRAAMKSAAKGIASK
jgi:hypothetical protein